MKIPTIQNYGNYSSNNYGAHCLMVDFGELELYFSYKTLVAFRAPGVGLVISENVWGPTTGKHLNFISENKKIRKSRDEFERIWKEVSEKMNISGSVCV